MGEGAREIRRVGERDREVAGGRGGDRKAERETERGTECGKRGEGERGKGGGGGGGGGEDELLSYIIALRLYII